MRRHSMQGFIKELVTATEGFEPSAFQAGNPARLCCHIRVLGGTFFNHNPGEYQSQGGEN